jgi:hypothetical protein
MRLLLAAALFLAPMSSALAADPLSEAVVQRMLAREAELLARLEEWDPDKHTQLLAIRDVDRRAYIGALVRISRAIEREERAPSPELVAAMRRMDAIKLRYPDGLDSVQGKDLKELRAEVTALAEEIFRLKQAERRERIQQLRASLEELEADVARRDREKDQLIRRFVDEFLEGDADL